MQNNNWQNIIDYMTSNLVQRIIDVYHNAPTAENLCKLFKYDLGCDFVMISWYISSSYWYISSILDVNIDDSINLTGWYITEEPTEKNIPIRHSKLSSLSEFKIKNAKVLFAKTKLNNIQPTTFTLSPMFSFALESFLEKLSTRDLMERQKFRQELMLSNILHSIRTPLNGILHMTNSIIDIGTGCNIGEQLNYLKQSAVALATNVFDIIDLTKLELNKLSISKDVFNLPEAVHSVIKMITSLNKSPNITIESYINPSVPKYIYSDKKRIKQILISLLENALQHTKIGEITLYVDSIVVNLSVEDSDRDHSLIDSSSILYNSSIQHEIVFSVCDPGSGMDEKTKAELFKPIEILTNSKQHGVSLRVSSLLADKLGGKLTLVYSQVNKGTCFNFNIIASEEESNTPDRKTLLSIKGKTVLLIGDKHRSTACKLFDEYEMNYFLASTIDEVTMLYEDKSFDIVFTSILIDKSRIKTKILVGLDEIIDYDAHVESITKSRLVELINMGHPKDKCHILIVEDEYINRIVLEKILRQLGYKRIDIAASGELALEFVSNLNNKYDAILVDIRMPTMSGFEFADKVHEFCVSNNISTYKMLGVTAQMILETDLKPWFNTFVYKPINIKELDNVLSRLV